VIEPDGRGSVQQAERVFDVTVLPGKTQKRLTYGGKRVEVKL